MHMHAARHERAEWVMGIVAPVMILLLQTRSPTGVAGQPVEDEQTQNNTTASAKPKKNLDDPFTLIQKSIHDAVVCALSGLLCVTGIW